jgi:energy-coupling factor transport system ATP-binding protein
MTTPHPGRQGGARVDARGWGWRHAGRSRPTIEGLDLTIEPGQRVLLLGASGSGKSTLLHGVAGLLGGSEDGCESGQLLVDGVSPTQTRHRIGMVLQNPDGQVILPRVGDDVAFGMENFNVPRDEIWSRVHEALTDVGLAAPLDAETTTLSGGQKQRLALAGVLAMRPGLLLLDEPTANLDPAGVIEVRDAVAAVADRTGATLVVIEHRTSVWLPVVDRVVVLDERGQILADGPGQEVVTRERSHLDRAGVWVPGHPPPRITRSGNGAREPSLVASGLEIGQSAAEPLSHRLDFEIGSGAATVVTGPNGTGKSTLALTLGGLIPGRHGRLQASTALAPSSRRRDPIRWRSRELLTRIGSVFQDPEHQFLTGDVRDEISLGPRALKRSPATVTEITDGLLARLRLTHLAEANPYTLSGGEKRRLSVATVLATRPRVMVLDEPTFGQDRNTWDELVQLLAEATDDGVAVVACTHDLDFVEALADRRIELPSIRGSDALGAHP